MAAIAGKAVVQMTVTIELTEPEARALDAMAGYGDDSFVKAFYANLGKTYMEPHERGLRTFLKSIREIMPGVLHKANAARQAFHDPSIVQEIIKG